MSLPHFPPVIAPGARSHFDPHTLHDPSKTVDIRSGEREAGGRGPNLAADPADPARQSTRFELNGEVGRGGMGEVHACADHHLGREVVAKILHAKYLERPVVVARFRDEIRITGRLEHPGVVPIYEAGVLPDGRPFFVMQRVWGLTLRQILDERPEPGEGRTRLLKVFEQVCHTMAYAHAQRIIHRDLNPTNIMVGVFGQVKVMDWGLAKSLEESDPAREDPGGCEGRGLGEPAAPSSTAHTQFGSVMGTLAYMPPEQAQGDIHRLDERCDVFGLGAILCEILTGLPPYISTDGMELLRSATGGDLDGAFARLDQSWADPCLIALAKSCLSGDIARRPRDAGAVVDHLGHYFEMALRQAEWDLVRFFDLSLDLFCIAGFDGHFHRVNENFSRVLGYPSADLMTNPFLHFVHPDDHARTIAVMGQLAEGISVVHFRNRYRDRQGQYRWFEWASKSLPSEGIIFAAAREVTDEVAMVERLRQFERLAAPSGAATADWCI